MLSGRYESELFSIVLCLLLAFCSFINWRMVRAYFLRAEPAGLKSLVSNFIGAGLMVWLFLGQSNDPSIISLAVVAAFFCPTLLFAALSRAG